MSDSLPKPSGVTAAATDARRPWAVRRADDDRSGRVVAEYLSQRGLTEVKHFEAYDDDRLNRELCGGRYEGVVFADLDALWQGVWKGHARIDRWLAAGVRIDVCDSALAPGELQHVVEAVYASWSAWQRAQRGRQIVAAVVLCSMAVAAMAVMVWLIPAAR